MAGNASPARAASSVGTISHHDGAGEAFTDGAESRPHPSVGDHSVGMGDQSLGVFADNTLRTSVNSISAAGDSADGPAAEIVVTSTPPATGPDSTTGEIRPSDDEIIAQENSIRWVHGEA